jgi:outer membrane immunogenic protein
MRPVKSSEDKMSGLVGRAVLLSLLVAAPAMAADLPIEVPVRASPAAIPTGYHWTGVYVGANLGYSAGRVSFDILDLYAAGPGNEPRLSQSMNGVIGGLQIGGNWQTGNAVFGLEADIQGTGQSTSGSAPGLITIVNPNVSAIPLAVTAAYNNKLSSFGTVRGRVGIAATRVLIYLTGGMVYGSWRSDLALTGLGAMSFPTSWNGGVLGGGVEAAVLDNITLKAEYLYFESRSSVNPFNPPGAALNVNRRLQDNIFRVGVNYLFTSGSVGCRPHMC